MKYLIRLDDACPFIDKDKWQRMENLLDRYKVKPLVGIIPANADPQTMIESESSLFWEKVHDWERKGWSIALHGFNHVCTTNQGGINPVHHRSEFAGLDYEEQSKKIVEGYAILMAQGIKPKYFFAPSHTYDETTLQVILDKTPIRTISDTVATKPYRMKNGLVVVPCQMGKLRKVLLQGFWTACYHPNNMDDKQFENLEVFLKEHQQSMMSFSELSLEEVGRKTLFDKFLSFCYYKMRKIKG